MWPSFWTLLACCDGTSPYKLLSQGSSPWHVSAAQPFTHPGLSLEYFLDMITERPVCLDLGLHAHYRCPGSQFNTNQLSPNPNETNVASYTVGTFNCTIWLQLEIIQVIYCVGRRQQHLHAACSQQTFQAFPIETCLTLSRGMKLSVYRSTDTHSCHKMA